MYKIAVMGDKDSIFGFAALGMDIYPSDEPTDAAATLKKLADNRFGIVYLTEELAAKIADEVEKYRSESRPALILIPGLKGNTGAGRADVNKSVEKAVGSNILE